MQEASLRSVRRRPSARLRTKTGCFKCRERRKKCDELRPVCSGCSRNGLSCRWPGTQSTSTSPNSTRSRSPGSLVTTSSRCPSPENVLFDKWGVDALQSPRACKLFEYYRSAVQPHLIRSHAHPIYFSSGWFIHGALQHSVLMDALLACSAVHLSCFYPEYRLTAIEFYSQAVSTTREQLEKKRLKGTEDWLIMLLVLAYLVEIWFFDDLRSIKRHLEAASHILHSRQLSFQRQELIPDHSFERLIAESILYNTSAVAMLMPESCDISFSVVSTHLDLFSSPGNQSNRLCESPLLGVSPELYFLVVEVSRLGLQAPSERGLEAANKLAARFSTWRENFMLENNDGGNNNNNPDPKFILGIRLYIFAIELLLSKLTERRQSAYAQLLVVAATEIIGKMGSYVESALCMDYYVWPLLIIGSAAKGQEECVDVVRRKMEDVMRTAGSGGVKMVINLLGRVWDFEGEGDDGLEVLLRTGRQDILRPSMPS
ncbi:uncharacterized protein PAC_13970 [Phialocephala subalpina]|uniref:Zn(2)-C6 fungal-type domain-containing protein n=1 Tax=Phialocephala subalpina TaxID=576137 RepID=A0A1L7XG99_9HELO|nr:uncharacterized protein PAC_13970 [Phialocephala subalpina]